MAKKKNIIKKIKFPLGCVCGRYNMIKCALGGLSTVEKHMQLVPLLFICCPCHSNIPSLPLHLCNSSSIPLASRVIIDGEHVFILLTNPNRNPANMKLSIKLALLSTFVHRLKELHTKCSLLPWTSKSFFFFFNLYEDKASCSPPASTLKAVSVYCRATRSQQTTCRTNSMFVWDNAGQVSLKLLYNVLLV